MTKLFRLFICAPLLAFTALQSDAVIASDDAEVGRRLHEELLLTERFYQDEELNAYIERIGQKIAANGDWPELEYHFFIIDREDINAFALPGGYIYINRGLINYLTSEAQLAAVLAHEVAHVTRRHHDRGSSSNTMGNIAVFMATLLTMNTKVGEAVGIWNAARESGFGREMELEADEYGASYLYKSGYDPQAMIEVLSILKDHETFMNRVARNAGGQATYHGVFASHPRGDTRLKEVVSQAGMLPPGEAYQGRDVYREMIDGITFGPSVNNNAPPGKARYVHRGLAITFIYPDDWTRTTEGSTIKVESRDSSVVVTLEVASIQDQELTAEALLLAKLGASELQDSEPLYETVDSDEAITGFVETDNGSQRVASIKLGSNVYYFSAVAPVNPDEDIDALQLSIMASFRRASNADLPPDREYQIYYRRLEPGETFLDLARASVLGRDAEPILRLINGYYPSGEPQPGTWMKLVK